MIKRIFLLIMALILVGSSVVAVDFLTGYEVHRDVSYADKEQNKLDIYLPNSASRRQTNGVVVFIHGGSWSGGDKSGEEFRCRLLASRGYITASINYTLWTEETAATYNVLSVVDEIDSAILMIKSYLAERGVEIDRVALAGYSAGAHLAMLYSYSKNDTSPAKIAFTATMSGPADISEAVWGRDMTRRVGRRLTGVEITDEMLDSGEAAALLSTVSPSAYVDNDTPPTLIMHGGRDDVVPVANAESLIAALEENGVAYDYVYMNRSDHVLIQNPLGHVKYTRLLLDYCHRYFGY